MTGLDSIGWLVFALGSLHGAVHRKSPGAGSNQHLDLTEIASAERQLHATQYLTPGEFKSLLALLATQQRIIVLLCRCAGLRHVEVIVLRWKHVDLDSGTSCITKLVYLNFEGHSKARP